MRLSEAFDALLARRDEDGAEAGEADEARRAALRFRDEFAERVVDGDFRVAARLAEVCGQLRGLDHGAVRHVALARMIAHDDVRAG